MSVSTSMSRVRATSTARVLVLLAAISIVASTLLALLPASVLATENQPSCGVRPIDLVFIIDRSGSMEEDDDSENTRMEWAQLAAKQLVDGLQADGGVGAGGIHQIGLTTFGDANEATTDLALGNAPAATVKAEIDGIENPDDGTPFNLGMAAGLANMNGGARVDSEVKQVYVFLSDGNPDPNSYTPSGAQTAAYLAAAGLAYAVAIGPDGGDLGGGGTGVSYDLMKTISNPNPGAFRSVVSASDLPNLFSDILEELTCPQIDIQKTADPTEMPAGGGSVTYTYVVVNTVDGEPLSNVVVTDDKCSPVAYVSGDANADTKLQFGESWTYTCTMNLTETTTNVATAQGTYGDQTFTDTDDATVTVAEPTPTPSESESEEPTPTPSESESEEPTSTPTPGESESEEPTPTPSESESEEPTSTPREDELGGMPTPTPAGGELPNTSIGQPMTGPASIVALLFLASLGALTWMRLASRRYG